MNSDQPFVAENGMYNQEGAAAAAAAKTAAIATANAYTDAALASAAMRPLVVTAAASVSPTAGDSGKAYRLTNASPVLMLPPSAGCVAGQTVFYVDCAGGEVTIYADGADTLESIGYEPGDFTTVGANFDNPQGLKQYVYAEVRYQSGGAWKIIGAWTFR